MNDELKCHRGIGPQVRGIALCASDDFSARYDLDRIRGVFSRPSHKLHGEDYKGKILVLNTAKGGVASAWMLRHMKESGISPLAYVFNSVNPILAQGAAFGEVTMVDRFEDGDISKLIRTGDELLVDPESGSVKILNRVANKPDE